MHVRRFPLEEFTPECLNLTEQHLLKIMIWCCMAHSELNSHIVDGTVNVTKYTGILLNCVTLSAYIPVSVLSEGWQMSHDIVIAPNWSPTGSARTTHEAAYKPQLMHFIPCSMGLVCTIHSLGFNVFLALTNVFMTLLLYSHSTLYNWPLEE